MSARILTTVHGRLLGLDQLGRLVCPGGIVAGGEGISPIVMPGNPLYTAMFEDFEGASQAYSTTPIDGWRSRIGSDAGCVNWTRTDGVGGSAVGTLGATTASMAVSGVQLDRGLDWKANQGNLTCEFRVKLGKVATIATFIGLTNQVAALQMPVNSSGAADTLTYNAADCVGALFDTTMTDANWWLVGNAASTAAAAVNTLVAPVAATYDIWRIELDKLGNATFYKNNVRVGQLALAVTPTVALTPVIASFNRATVTSGTCIVTADYCAIAASRV